MRSFHFYIDDVSRSRPTEFQVEVASEARARELAEEMLARSTNHLGVEVCERGRRLFGLGTFATRSICELMARSPSIVGSDGLLRAARVLVERIRPQRESPGVGSPPRAIRIVRAASRR